MNRASQKLSAADYARMKRLCEVHPQKVVAEIMKIAPKTVWSARKKGFRHYDYSDRLRLMPSDFPLRADTMTLEELGAHYGATHKIVARWGKQVGRKYKSKPNVTPLPIPADFEAVWKRLGTMRTATHFGVAHKTVWKWQVARGLFRYRHAKAPVSQIGWADRYYAERRAA